MKQTVFGIITGIMLCSLWFNWYLMNQPREIGYTVEQAQQMSQLLQEIEK